ncbi:MAG: hypothetical protein GVY24_00250, partial [Planctomycetes bacterium]|nr:hypothetical protein [Planctomycetota bacterium]
MAQKTTLIFSQLRLRRDDGRTLRYTRAHFARLEGLFGLGIAAVVAAVTGVLFYLMHRYEGDAGVWRFIVPIFTGVIFAATFFFGLVKLLRDITVEVDGEQREIRTAIGVGPLCKRRVFHSDKIKHVAVGEAETAPFAPDSETYYRAWLQFKDGHTPETWPLEQSKKIDPPLSVGRQIADRLGVPLEAEAHESAEQQDAVTQAIPALADAQFEPEQDTEPTASPPPDPRIVVREDGSDRLSLMVHPMGLRATWSVWVRLLFGLPFFGFGALIALGLLDPEVWREAEDGGVWFAAIFALAFISIGLSASLNNFIKMWRRTVIEARAGHLTVRETFSAISRTHRWNGDRIEQIILHQKRGGGGNEG